MRNQGVGTTYDVGVPVQRLHEGDLRVRSSVRRDRCIEWRRLFLDRVYMLLRLDVTLFNDLDSVPEAGLKVDGLLHLKCAMRSGSS